MRTWREVWINLQMAMRAHFCIAPYQNKTMGFPLKQNFIPLDLCEFIKFWAASCHIIWPLIGATRRPWRPRKILVGCWVIAILFFYAQNFLIENRRNKPALPPNTPPTSNEPNRPIAASSQINNRAAKKRTRSIPHLSGEFSHFDFFHFQLINWNSWQLTLPFLPSPLPLLILTSACRRVITDKQPCCQKKNRSIAHLSGEFSHFDFFIFN